VSRTTITRDVKGVANKQCDKSSWVLAYFTSDKRYFKHGKISNQISGKLITIEDHDTEAEMLARAAELGIEIPVIEVRPHRFPIKDNG